MKTEKILQLENTFVSCLEDYESFPLHAIQKSYSTGNVVPLRDLPCTFQESKDADLEICL